MATEERHFRSLRERTHYLGDFYTSLACCLLGGNKSLNMTGFGDILYHDRGLVLEVKGCDNHHFFKIFTEQLDAYLANELFPNRWYVLFGYRNGNHNGGCLSRNTPTPRSLDEFLAAHTVFMCVIDTAVLDAIRKVSGTVRFRRRGDDCEVVKVNRTIVNKFGTVPDEMFRMLKLNPKSFRVEVKNADIRFRGFQMKFECTLILPRKTLRRVVDPLFETGAVGLLRI
ncbi:MAG: hypothetical protein AAB655_00365 [Patescibacteria group bacterium]